MQVHFSQQPKLDISNVPQRWGIWTRNVWIYLHVCYTVNLQTEGNKTSLSHESVYHNKDKWNTQTTKERNNILDMIGNVTNTILDNLADMQKEEIVPQKKAP